MGQETQKHQLHRLSNIEERNKYIASFMGRKFLPDVYVKSLKYHSDWSELMKVVDKLEKLGCSSRIHYDWIGNDYFCDFVDHDNNEMGCATGNSKIKAVYEAVYQSIPNLPSTT